MLMLLDIIPGLGLLSGELVREETWTNIYHYLLLLYYRASHLWYLDLLLDVDGV